MSLQFYFLKFMQAPCRCPDHPRPPVDCTVLGDPLKWTLMPQRRWCLADRWHPQHLGTRWNCKVPASPAPPPPSADLLHQNLGGGGEVRGVQQALQMILVHTKV